jgi:hypothetical protein
MCVTVRNFIDVMTEGKEFSQKVFSVGNHKSGRHFQTCSVETF